MNRKYEDRYVTSINFERSAFNSYRQSLPSGVSVCDGLNEFIKNSLLKITKVKVPDKSAVRIESEVNLKDKNGASETQNLNIISCSIEDLKKYINNIDDRATAWKVVRTFKLGAQLGETKAKKL